MPGAVKQLGRPPIESGVIFLLVSGSTIPVGYSRVMALDARYVKTIATSATAPGTTGGNAAHDHPFPQHTHTGGSHSHGWGVQTVNLTLDNFTGSGQNYTNPLSHTHTGTGDAAASGSFSNNVAGATWPTTSTDPSYFEVIFIKSDGTATGAPAGVVAFNDSATVPGGWNACDGTSGTPDMRGRFIKGAPAAGAPGGTNAAGHLHTHAGVSHTHAAAGGHTHTMSFSSTATTLSDGYNPGGGTASMASTSHSHTIGAATIGSTSPAADSAASAPTDSADGQPPFIQLLAVQNISGGPSQFGGMLAFWDGALAGIPYRWRLCDGTGGTLDLTGDKIVKCATVTGDIGGTGGAATHTHTGGTGHTHVVASHTHSHSGEVTSAPDPDAIRADVGDGTLEMARHVHNVDATSAAATATSGSTMTAATANTDNRPPYTELAVIKLLVA